MSIPGKIDKPTSIDISTKNNSPEYTRTPQKKDNSTRNVEIIPKITRKVAEKPQNLNDQGATQTNISDKKVESINTVNFLNQQVSPTNSSDNKTENSLDNKVEIFFNGINNITDEISKEVCTDIKDKATKEYQETKELIDDIKYMEKRLIPMGSFTIFAGLVFCFTPLIPVGVGLIIGGAVTLIAGLLLKGVAKLYAKSIDITPLSKLENQISIQEASSLINGIFNNADETIKETLKATTGINDIDFDLVTDSIKKSLKNPNVLQAVKKLNEVAKKNLMHDTFKKQTIEERLAKSTEDLLTIFFAAVDESLEEKEKAFMQNAKVEYLKAFFVSNKEKPAETIIKTLSKSKAMEALGFNPINSKKLYDSKILVNGVNLGIANYLNTNYPEDSRLQTTSL